MKKILTFILLFLNAFPFFSQTFYQSFKDKHYKELMKNGLTYVKTGNETVDQFMKEALENEWKVCSYRIVEPEERLKEDDVQITFLTDGYNSRKTQLTIVSEAELRRSGVRLYHTIATGDIEWFTHSEIEPGAYYFIPYMVSLFNDMAIKINNNQVNKRWTSLFKKMHTLYIPSQGLKGKTLLITCSTFYINEAELKKAGIQYESVSFERFLELESKDPANYCLLYFRPEIRASDITIYNMEDKSIIYSRHALDIRKLDKEDIIHITNPNSKL